MDVFGNARTPLNGNSSRFAKYIQLMFTNEGSLIGGKRAESYHGYIYYVMLHYATLHTVTHGYILLHIITAEIEDYMLEKSRVVSQRSGEKNFRIFYYFLAGVNKQKYDLQDPSQYRYLATPYYNTGT